MQVFFRQNPRLDEELRPIARVEITGRDLPDAPQTDMTDFTDVPDPLEMARDLFDQLFQVLPFTLAKHEDNRVESRVPGIPPVMSEALWVWGDPARPPDLSQYHAARAIEEEESTESTELDQAKSQQPAPEQWLGKEMVQSINHYAWWVTILAGIPWIISGIVTLIWAGLLAATFQGYYFVDFPQEVFFIIQGILGLIAGVMGHVQCVPKIAANQYSAAKRSLLIWGIVGAIALGGVLFLVQFLLIKIHYQEKTVRNSDFPSGFKNLG